MQDNGRDNRNTEKQEPRKQSIKNKNLKNTKSAKGWKARKQPEHKEQVSLAVYIIPRVTFVSYTCAPRQLSSWWRVMKATVCATQIRRVERDPTQPEKTSSQPTPLRVTQRSPSGSADCKTTHLQSETGYNTDSDGPRCCHSDFCQHNEPRKPCRLGMSGWQTHFFA